MNNVTKTLAVTAMVMGFGSGAMAQVDVASLTCGAFMAQEDDAARLETAHGLLLWIADTANFDAVGPLERYKMAAMDTATTTTKSATDTTTANEGWTDEEMVIMMKAKCFHQLADANVIERMKTTD